uniref:Peptidase C78, ubiquitin fold modifier-specific peptidase 1/ 2 n=1 Tax=Globisporangium ultimum (strain ATCC 200006 / CBS 805.95 / DAOM BR144) TaxID=431595 RepID=K3WTA6_GLOUD
MVTGVVPSTLLRALKTLAVTDHDEDAGSRDAELPTGVLIGTNNPVEAEESSRDQVAIWGLLDPTTNVDDAKQFLPGGLSVVGHWVVLQRAENDAQSHEAALQVAAKGRTAKDAVVLVYIRSSETLQLFQVEQGSSVRAVHVDVIECLHVHDFLRTIQVAPIRCAFDVHVQNASELSSQMARWKQRINDSESTFFRVANGNAVFGIDGLDVSAGATVSKPLASVVKFSLSSKQQQTSESSSNKSKKQAAKKKSKAAFDAWDNDDVPGSSVAKGSTTFKDEKQGYLRSLELGDIVNVELLCSLSDDTNAAPVLYIPDSKATAKSSTHQSIHLSVDTMAIVHLDATIADALHLVREQVAKQLDLLEAEVHNQSTTSTAFQAHHFALRGAAVFPLTVVSPVRPHHEGIASTTGKKLHEWFLQPVEQPRFHVPRCSLVAQSKVLSDLDVLVNVHEGIPPSGVPQGKQYLVDGFYGYYHYMQQNMNDKGWGCAYRSLQTLASWLHLNHYTDKQSPSHVEIQETLVRIGDKPSSFVKSREWIGSMEVGYVLDELYGVSFRSLNVPSGPRLVEHAQELKHHFETQGTPVMMGGGQLAFTLLGIDYNESTGECAFLILDPHYTGQEDLHVIQTKTLALEGYKAIACGWRKANTFAKSSFYNLCLPQRPAV